jgi:hypothetical protein
MTATILNFDPNVRITTDMIAAALKDPADVQPFFVKEKIIINDATGPEIVSMWFEPSLLNTMSLLDFVNSLKTDYVHNDKSLSFAAAALAIQATNLLRPVVEENPQATLDTDLAIAAIVGELLKVPGPIRILAIADLVNPAFEQKHAKVLSKGEWNELQTMVRGLIVKHPNAHADFTSHWHSINQGTVPFGYTLAE